MQNIHDIQTGALHLLNSTCALLNDMNATYIIVGGWTPYLLNSSPIGHPGTKDIDVLFDGGYEKGKLGEIIEKFLEQGFLLSAKHEFQLFKEVPIKGRNFIYNVDLLHPLETVKPKEIYVEHIDLGIPANKYQSETFKMKSIVLPSSQSLFKHNIITHYDLHIHAKNETTRIPLMGEAGTLITKSKSINVEKRYRDSLDIYLTIRQSQDPELLLNTIHKIKKEDLSTYCSLYGIREAHDKGTLFENILKYISLRREEYQETIIPFLDKAGLMQPV